MAILEKERESPLSQKYPAVMAGSERPSPKPEKRSVPSHTGGERILEMLWKLQMP